MKYLRITFIGLCLVILGCSDSTEPTQNSLNMSLKGTYNTSGYTQSVFIKQINNVLYGFIADGADGLVVVDATSPAVITPVSDYNTNGTATDVYTALINGTNYAFVSDAAQGYVIINLSNINSPALDTIITFAGDAVLTSVVDTTNRIAVIGTLGGKVYTYNLSSLPDSVSYLGVYDAVDGVNGIQLSSNLAYIANSSIGVQIISLSNPASPLFIGGFNTPGFVNDVAVSGFYCYAADGSNGVVIYDVTNPFQPVFKSAFSTKGIAYGLVYDNFILYISESNYVETYSVSVPSTPAPLGYYKTNDAANNIFYFNSLLYVANGNAGMTVLSYGQ